MNILNVIILSLNLLQLPCKADPSYPDPVDLKVISSDVTNFWKAYDLLWKDTTANPFEHYLAMGSKGLEGFIPGRINSAASLKKRVIKERTYYEAIRQSQVNLASIEKTSNELFASLKQIYPQFASPNIYLVIGRINSGGTSTADGIIIGLETFSEVEAQTSGGRKSISMQFLPSVIAHEVIHFQQQDYNDQNTLLTMCLREGSADFITCLLGREEIKLVNGDDVYAYGDQHEKELVKSFLTGKDNEDYSQWLYNSSETTTRPADLGYWIGYQIANSYYENAADKVQAIYDILHIKDANQFLTKSRYLNKVQP